MAVTVVIDGVEHTLRGTACSCLGWDAPIGKSIWREFDRHLLEVRSDDCPHGKRSPGNCGLCAGIDG